MKKKISIPLAITTISIVAIFLELDGNFAGKFVDGIVHCPPNDKIISTSCAGLYSMEFVFVFLIALAISFIFLIVGLIYDIFSKRNKK